MIDFDRATARCTSVFLCSTIRFACVNIHSPSRYPHLSVDLILDFPAVVTSITEKLISQKSHLWGPHFSISRCLRLSISRSIRQYWLSHAPRAVLFWISFSSVWNRDGCLIPSTSRSLTSVAMQHTLCFSVDHPLVPVGSVTDASTDFFSLWSNFDRALQTPQILPVSVISRYQLLSSTFVVCPERQHDQPATRWPSNTKTSFLRSGTSDIVLSSLLSWSFKQDAKTQVTLSVVIRFNPSAESIKNDNMLVPATFLASFDTTVLPSTLSSWFISHSLRLVFFWGVTLWWFHWLWTKG